jgi:hypothetical protein
MTKKLFNLIIFMVVCFSFQQIYTQSKELRDIETKKINNNIYCEKFKDLLLVINFNSPYYQNIQFLKELYSPIFKNIVFYGEKPNPEVFDVYTCNGFFLTNVLQDVLTRFPKFKGYLVLQDDCVLNFWNCLSLDQNKIWFPTKFIWNGGTGINAVKINTGEYVSGFVWDGWNHSYDGWNWNRTVVNDLTILKVMQEAYLNLAIDEKAILEKNIGSNNVAAQICDFFYFPSRFNEAILRLCQVFKIVEHEAAIPTIFCSLDLIKNFENLDIHALVFPVTDKNYPKSLHWAHPVKFSNLNNRAVVTTIFNKILQEAS